MSAQLSSLNQFHYIGTECAPLETRGRLSNELNWVQIERELIGRENSARLRNMYRRREVTVTAADAFLSPYLGF